MGLLWCSRGKPARLSGPDADRSGCAAQVTPAQCGAVRIGPLSPRDLEAKMRGDACECVNVCMRMPCLGYLLLRDVSLVYR